MFTIHVAHPSSIVFELARCDFCNRKEQAALLFASVGGIHTPIATSKARVKVCKHTIQIHLLLTDHYGHSVSSLAAQTSVSTHSEDSSLPAKIQGDKAKLAHQLYVR